PLVAQDDADECHAFEVQSLRDHLRAENDVGLAGADAAPCSFKGALAAHRVHVEADDAGGGERGDEFLLGTLCAGADGDHALRATTRTGDGKRLLAPAEMATQFEVAADMSLLRLLKQIQLPRLLLLARRPAAMNGHGHVVIGTLGHPLALGTEEKVGEAAAI